MTTLRGAVQTWLSFGLEFALQWFSFQLESTLKTVRRLHGYWIWLIRCHFYVQSADTFISPAANRKHIRPPDRRWFPTFEDAAYSGLIDHLCRKLSTI